MAEIMTVLFGRAAELFIRGRFGMVHAYINWLRQNRESQQKLAMARYGGSRSERWWWPTTTNKYCITNVFRCSILYLRLFSFSEALQIVHIYHLYVCTILYNGDAPQQTVCLHWNECSWVFLFDKLLFKYQHLLQLLWNGIWYYKCWMNQYR